MQLLGLFDVNIEITMEITVRRYVVVVVLVKCSICLHADYGNQTMSIDMTFNHRERFFVRG